MKHANKGKHKPCRCKHTHSIVWRRAQENEIPIKRAIYNLHFRIYLWGCLHYVEIFGDGYGSRKNAEWRLILLYHCTFVGAQPTPLLPSTIPPTILSTDPVTVSTPWCSPPLECPWTVHAQWARTPKESLGAQIFRMGPGDQSLRLLGVLYNDLSRVS